jgi:hypothetical protein
MEFSTVPAAEIEVLHEDIGDVQVSDR